MRARWWWLRLQVWQWCNAWRVQPVRRTLPPLCWFFVAMVVPAAVSLAGAVHARAALEWMLSLDVPLALLVAIQVGAAAVARASRGDAESWIAPRSWRGLPDRVLRMARWLHLVRWPLAVAMAALILARGDAQSAQKLAELLLLASLGLACGALFAWNMVVRPKPDDKRHQRGTSPARGLAVLSSVPFQQAARQLQARRMVLLTVPVMIAAPMGALVQQVAGAMVVWIVLLYVSTWMREARRTVVALGTWIPGSALAPWRLHWLVWRYVIAAALLSIAALWAGWRVVSPGQDRVSP